MAQLIIDNGLKTFEIADKNGNVRGVITINPSDFNLLPRTDETLKYFESLQEVVDNLVATEDAFVAAAKVDELDRKMKDKINYMLDDDNASNVIFGNQNCMNTLNGVPFVQRFLEAITPVIKEEINNENKVASKKISKYTDHLKKGDN